MVFCVLAIIMVQSFFIDDLKMLKAQLREQQNGKAGTESVGVYYFIYLKYRYCWIARGDK